MSPRRSKGLATALLLVACGAPPPVDEPLHDVDAVIEPLEEVPGADDCGRYDRRDYEEALAELEAACVHLAALRAGRDDPSREVDAAEEDAAESRFREARARVAQAGERWRLACDAELEAGAPASVYEALRRGWERSEQMTWLHCSAS